MMRISVVSVLCIALTLPLTSDASRERGRPDSSGPDTPPETEVRDDIWWHLAAVPAYAFLQLNLHEGSHALTGLALGYSVNEYRPYPHMITYREKVTETVCTPTATDGGSGCVEKTGYVTRERFAFGSVDLRGSGDDWQKGLIYAAPVMTDVLLFTSADLTLTFIDRRSWAAPILYFAGMVAPWMDFTYNVVIGRSAQNDVSRWTSLAGADTDLIRFFGTCVAMAGLVRLILRGYDVFLIPAEGPTDGPTLTVMPMSGPGMAGLALGGSF